MTTKQTAIQKVMHPLHYAMYDIHGPTYGTFPVYINTGNRMTSFKEYQDVNTLICDELKHAKLTVTITNPDNLTSWDERLYFIQEPMKNNAKFYTNTTNKLVSYEINIDIQGLNADVIPLIRYADKDSGIVPTDKIPDSILTKLYKAKYNISERQQQEIDKILYENGMRTYIDEYGHEHTHWIGEGTGGKSFFKDMAYFPPTAADYAKLDFLDTFKSLAEQIRAYPDHVQFRFQMNTHLHTTPYDTELDKIIHADTHSLYPAVESGKRAMLSDGRCKSFGCKFTGSELEIREHLCNSPECRYINYYAASHSKLAAKTSARDSIRSYINKEDIAKFQRRDKSKLWYLATFKTDKYVCASALCDFTCETLHKLMEHYRLLGARGPAIDEYYKDNPELLISTTEVENREFMHSMINPDGKTHSMIMLVPIFAARNRSDVDKEVDKLRAQLTNTDAKCVLCRKARPNAVLPVCGHVDMMCFDCRKEKTKQAGGEWHCYSCYGTQYCKFVINIDS